MGHDKKHYTPGLRVYERGRVEAIADGVIWISGLPSASIGAVLRANQECLAQVFHLEPGVLSAVALTPADRLRPGMSVEVFAKTLAVPAGDDLLGRVITPLGAAMDSGPPPHSATMAPLEQRSPPIMHRDFVSRPLYTGCKIVDTLFPIGRGQRQLILGDNGAGKSTLALDTVLAQQGTGVRCIYVLIGQRRSAVEHVINTLRERGALTYTVVVVAEASSTAGMKFQAPYAGCAIAQAWMERGHDTLIVYDDLSTHAQVFRELSLLLRVVPGREAYPADIFFLHARLLERAACLQNVQGGGSMTALPLAETEQGELAAYIPTNLISITDGQIYLDSTLFARGQLPAIDVTLSVSRIGGQAQHPAIRRMAGRMKLDYLQFLELESFLRLGAPLNEPTQTILAQGQMLRLIFMQEPMDPFSATEQLAWLTAYTAGLLQGLSGTRLNTAKKMLRLAHLPPELTLESSYDAWCSEISARLRG